MIDVTSLPAELIKALSGALVAPEDLLSDQDAMLGKCENPEFYGLYSDGFGESYLLTSLTTQEMEDKVLELSRLSDEPSLKFVYSVKEGCTIYAHFYREVIEQDHLSFTETPIPVEDTPTQESPKKLKH